MLLERQDRAAAFDKAHSGPFGKLPFGKLPFEELGMYYMYNVVEWPSIYVSNFVQMTTWVSWNMTPVASRARSSLAWPSGRCTFQLARAGLP